MSKTTDDKPTQAMVTAWGVTNAEDARQAMIAAMRAGNLTVATYLQEKFFTPGGNVMTAVG